jgi:hypothetical protein
MPTLFDPLRWLARHGVVATLGPDGEVHLQFDQYMKRDVRERIRRIARNWAALLKMQLDVPPGTMPRTVRQLIATGRIRVVEGRYKTIHERGE